MQVHQMQSEALSESDILIAWGSNSDGLIEWSSPAWRRFTGIPSAQQAKHRWQTCLQPEDYRLFHNGASDDNDGRPKLASEFRLLHHDGTFHPVLGYIQFSRDKISRDPVPHAACFEIKTSTANDVDAAPAQQNEPPEPEPSEPEPRNPSDQSIEFNHQVIRNLFGNDAQSLRELAELFDTTCEESLAFLATAFRNPNQHDLFSTAHRLKGAIANMNAPQVLECCQKLEEAIQANEIAIAEKMSQQVIRSVIQLRDRVKEEFTP